MQEPNQQPEGQRRVSNPDRWRPGKFKATPIDWMVTKSKEGLPQVSVLFRYQQQGEMPGTVEERDLTWYGSFKGKALERTMETLFMLGLREPPYPAMETGRDGRALDEQAEVEIVIEHRVMPDGQKRAGVSWVNRVGGRGLDSKLEAGEGQAVFSEANAAFAQYLQANGAQPRTPAAPGKIADAIHNPPAQGNLGDADIPF